MLLTRCPSATALICAVALGVSAAAGAGSPENSPATRLGGALAPAAVIVYNQPPRPAGGLLLSSLRDPDGSSADQWAWDGFKLGWAQSITELRWRGAYDPARLGSGGPVHAFAIEIYPSIASGAQPDVSQPPLARYKVESNAGERRSEVLGGLQTYDYGFSLPEPFEAAAGVKYWVQIQAYQSGSPDWGLAAGMNGDGSYFRRIPGQGANYQLVAGDAAFMLVAGNAAIIRIYLPWALAD